jgi:hypothetical protein
MDKERAGGEFLRSTSAKALVCSVDLHGAEAPFFHRVCTLKREDEASIGQ